MNRRGVTIIELLMALVVGAIAFFALAVPLVAERSFWGSGKRQAEAQRDAQIALRALARVARQSLSYAVTGGGNQITFTFKNSSGVTTTSCFQGGQAFGNQLQRYTTACGAGSATVLIDGAKSRVTSLVITPIAPNLVRVQLQVTQQLSAQNQRNALMVTDLFLRNAP